MSGVVVGEGKVVVSVRGVFMVEVVSGEEVDCEERV